jgi:hypothetical protein
MRGAGLRARQNVRADGASGRRVQKAAPGEADGTADRPVACAVCNLPRLAGIFVQWPPSTPPVDDLPRAIALKELTAPEEARTEALVEQAVG